LRDVLSGMYIVRVDRLRDALFETRGFSIESEIATHIIGTSGKIAEIPITYRKRLGKKKLGIIHGFKIALDMIKLAWRYNPVFVIFTIGSLMLIPGLVLGTWVLYQYIVTGIKYYVKGVVAVMLSVGGFISLALAILSLYLKRMEYRIYRRIMQLEEKLRGQEE